MTPAEIQTVIEPDEFARYARKVRASAPHFNINPAAAFASFGFQQWKRAKSANQRADAAEAALASARERYDWLRGWYIRGGSRAEIHPHAHMVFTTPEIFDAGVAAAIRAQGSEG